MIRACGGLSPHKKRHGKAVKQHRAGIIIERSEELVKQMMKSASRKTAGAAVLFTMALLGAGLWAPTSPTLAQVLKGSRGPIVNPNKFRWTIRQEFVQALGRGRQFVPGTEAVIRPAVAQQLNYRDSARIIAAARTIRGGALSSNSSKSISMAGGDKPMLTPGTAAGAPMMVQPAPAAPQRQDPVGGQHQPISNGNLSRIGVAATQSTTCYPGHWGISEVDGFKPPLAFGPQADWNPYRIEGCGFGNTPGQVWLTGVKYQPAASGGGGGINVAPRAIRLHPDWVKLDIYQNHWSNGTIDVVVDPNASGYLATDNTVTLLVITANGQQYQLTGFTFVPMYVEQKLAYVPQRVLASLWGGGMQIKQGAANLAQVTDANGNKVTSYIFSPSDGSGILPGHTLAVLREDNSAAFAGGTDAFDFTGLIFITQHPLYHADLSAQTCQSIYPNTGKFSTSGNWLFTWTGSPVKFTISWQEQSCAIPSLGTGSLSAYALDLYVLVPQGTMPW
jgi:hypothetical protein